MPLDARLPVFPGHRFFGNLLELRRDRLGTFAKIARLGNNVAIHIGRRPVIMTSEPAFIHEVLVEQAYEFLKGYNYQFIERLLGMGLVTSEGDFHRRQRKLAAPALTPKRIASYADTMAAFAERAQSRWKDGETID